MPIIGNVGRRSFKVRFLNLAIHVVLIAGATTMVYPLMIMVSGSLKSRVDSRYLNAIPAYLYDETMLFRKWVESKYNDTVSEYNVSHRQKIYSYEDLMPPRKTVRQRYEDWNLFLAENNERLLEVDYSLGNASGAGVKPELLREFTRKLKKEPDVRGDIKKLNQKYDLTYPSWENVSIPVMNYMRRGVATEFKPIVKRMFEFALKQNPRNYIFYSVDSFFVEQVLKPAYGQNIRRMNDALGTIFRSWSEITLAQNIPSGPLREDWIACVKIRLGLDYIKVSDAALPDYQAFLRDKYQSIDLFQQRYGKQYGSFDDLALPERPPRSGAAAGDWAQFIESVAKPEHLGIRSVELMYRDFLKARYGTLEELASAHEFGIAQLDDLALTAMLPEGNVAYEDDWIEFVDTVADRAWIRPDFAATRNWINYIAEPYKKGKDVDLAAMNDAFGTNYKDIRSDIAVPLTEPTNPKLAELWQIFMRDVCPRHLLVLDVQKAAGRWDEFVRHKYASVNDVNRAYAWTPAAFENVAIPAEDIDFFGFQEIKRHAFWEFITRNYATVMEVMVYNGRAVLNTVIYCGLMILTSLIVNPLAAYAMSRYKPPSQYKVLLFLMLTMAFPGMVLGIPNFLILRNLHLLNTFAALILPAMANGYQIFLLKGFFDALPRELYESAQLDGASEWTMFWQITMATSKPILAVIALHAFTLAYSNFMMAFIVCQNPKMWTMMVHIYQLMQHSSQGVSFAALVVAALPTLLVFIFCQNIIIRGIVVPTEK